MGLNTKIGMDQVGRPAPLWFRKFKKVFVNTENAALTLLAVNHPPDSFVLLAIKVISSLVIENLETVLGNGQRYVPSDTSIEEKQKQ
jgi:hypothetical protein